MTEAEAILFINDRVKYKKDVQIFSFRPAARDELRIRISRMSEDADGNDFNHFFPFQPLSNARVQPVVTEFNILLEFLYKATERDLAALIYEHVLRFEIHELNEWLRIDEAPLKEPHPDLYRDGRIWSPKDEKPQEQKKHPFHECFKE